MNKHMHTLRRTALATGTLTGAQALVPAVALAEEERSGISLLIPTMAEFVPACIAFVIIFTVLAKLVWPAVVKAMDEREKTLTAQVEAADEAKRKLADTDRQCTELIAQARAEAAEIVNKAKEEAEQERAKIIYDAHVSATEAIEKGHKAVETERARAMEELASSVTDLSVEIAGKIIGESLNEAEQRKLAMRYLDEMESQDA